MTATLLEHQKRNQLTALAVTSAAHHLGGEGGRGDCGILAITQFGIGDQAANEDDHRAAEEHGRVTEDVSTRARLWQGESAGQTARSAFPFRAAWKTSSASGEPDPPRHLTFDTSASRAPLRKVALC
jgi:hypothetical protein